MSDFRYVAQPTLLDGSPMTTRKCGLPQGRGASRGATRLGGMAPLVPSVATKRRGGRTAEG
jgi:hypothetical protein